MSEIAAKDVRQQFPTTNNDRIRLYKTLRMRTKVSGHYQPHCRRNYTANASAPEKRVWIRDALSPSVAFDP